MPINENSESESLAGLAGSNTANGPGIWGSSDHGRGVVGVTVDGVGVWGHSAKGRAVVGAVNEEGTGVWGEVKTGRAVVGVVNGGEGTGVWGQVKAGRAIVGAVEGRDGVGVWGESTFGVGVVGKDSGGGDGVRGEGRRGVVGISPTYQGVYGQSKENAGVVGESQQFHGVFGISHTRQFAGVYGVNKGGGFAGIFEGLTDFRGEVQCHKELQMMGADVAEQFDVSSAGDDVPAGTVAVLDDHGGITACDKPYDRRVAGIVSGAGDRVPAVVLDQGTRAGTGERAQPRRPVAVVGKAWCLADATAEPISVGDLLTSSGRRGHAMRASEPEAAFGAVIGKALTPLAGGVGLVLVLVGLR